MTETLVALTHGEDTLAITRDVHGVWLGGNGIAPGDRAVTTFPDGTWVVGGLLPDGAERAVVRDVAGFESEAVCGAGAWMASSSDEQPAVRFETADGRIVTAPPPAQLRVRAGQDVLEYVTPRAPAWTPVADARIPCPACDTIAWVSTSDSVRCARCGHQATRWVGYAGLVAPPDREPVEPAEAAAAERWAQRTSLRLTLEELRGETAFVVADSRRQPRLAGRTVSDGRPTAVTVEHGDSLTIKTTSDHPEPDMREARQALQTMVHEAQPWPEVSAPALSIWLDAQDRAARHAVATAERLTHDVEVERVAVTFAGLRSATSWSLVGHLAGASVVIGGRGHLPRRLHRVLDPVYELVGR